MKRCFSLLVPACAAWAVSAAAVVSDVSASQSGATLKVRYALSGAPAIVSFDVLTNGVSVGTENLGGAVGTGYVAENGLREISWRPAKAWLVARGGQAVDVQAAVTARSCSAPPDYVAFDLETGGVAYYDTTNDFPLAFSDDCWKTRYLVMRRIPAAFAKFRMGSPVGESGRSDSEKAHYVTLSNDFYLAVFETTRQQWNRVDSGSATDGTLPKNKISYDACRGTGKNWPADGHALDGTGWLHKLRAKFGNAYEFDMPTEAQWEFACRAGTERARYDSSAAVSDLAYYSENGQPQKTAPTNVGSRLPNAWGLYDMLGNLWDMTLDHGDGSALSADEAFEPVGDTDPTRTKVILRGGGHWDADWQCRAARRLAVERTAADYYGLRVALIIK